MSFWLVLLSCATAAFSATGLIMVWMVDTPWFTKLMPSKPCFLEWVPIEYWKIFWCTLPFSVTVLLILNVFFVVALYSIFHATGSAWSMQFSAWGAKWISPVTSALVIWLLYGSHQHPLVSRGNAIALLCYLIGSILSVYWRTPLLGR